MALFQALQDVEAQLTRFQTYEKELVAGMQANRASISSLRMAYYDAVGRFSVSTPVVDVPTIPIINPNADVHEAIARAIKRSAALTAQLVESAARIGEAGGIAPMTRVKSMLAEHIVSTRASMISIKATFESASACRRMAEEELRDATFAGAHEVAAEKAASDQAAVSELQARALTARIAAARMDRGAASDGLVGAEADARAASDAVLVATGKLDQARAREGAASRSRAAASFSASRVGGSDG